MANYELYQRAILTQESRDKKEKFAKTRTAADYELRTVVLGGRPRYHR